jgi:hypothetical protein
MKSLLRPTFVALFGLVFTAPLFAQVTNGGFETGDFAGWTADANWVIANDSRGYYAGWQGAYWAWSGGKGEAATGKLRSNPFRLDKDAVHLMIAGWDSRQGTGKPRRWNYVTLNLASGRELDRVWAPNTTTFVPAILDGSGYRGQTVYIEAVDDAEEATYSMLCIDDVRTVFASFPEPPSGPLSPLPAFDAHKSLKLEDDRYLVEVNRANGTISRIRDKQGDLELIREPRLADNFRFTLPIPGKEPWQTIEANYIYGRQQKLSSFDASAKKLTLHWNKPLRNYLGQRFDVSAVMGIELTQQGVWFSLRIDNASRYQIGEVFFPLVGGIEGIGKNVGQLKATVLNTPTSPEAVSANGIFRVFTNMSWLGDQGPEQFYSYPKGTSRPWMEFSTRKSNRSVYMGTRQSAGGAKVLRLELVPSNSATVREDGNWPRPGELRGQPVGVSACFVDFVGAPAHNSYQAAPVLISFHDGDWHEAKKIYQNGNVPR